MHNAAKFRVKYPNMRRSIKLRNAWRMNLCILYTSREALHRNLGLYLDKLYWLVDERLMSDYLVAPFFRICIIHEGGHSQSGQSSIKLLGAPLNGKL